MEIYGNTEIWKYGNMIIWKYGNIEIIKIEEKNHSIEKDRIF